MGERGSAKNVGFPYTTKQINKAGDRIRKARAKGEPPRVEDLALLNEFRAAHFPTT
jgi:hypothetical protein